MSLPLEQGAESWQGKETFSALPERLSWSQHSVKQREWFATPIFPYKQQLLPTAYGTG